MNRRLPRLLTVAVPLLLLGAAGVVTWRHVRQARLDTDLVAAVVGGDTPRVRALLDRGANPNARQQAQTSSAWQGLVDAMMGRRRAAGPPVLMAACDFNWWETARALADHGADPNVTDELGMTPVVWATALHQRCPGLALALLRHGADYHRRVDRGRTLLMMAVAVGDWEVARELLRRGVPADERDPAGHNALSWLAMCPESRDSLAVARELLRRGADPRAPDALAWAAGMRNTRTVRLLRGRGANSRSPVGTPPPAAYISNNWPGRPQ